MTMVVKRCRLALSYYLAAAFLLLAFLNAPLTGTQPLPWQLCNATAGNFTEGSAYQANIRVLASAFPKNASASPALFAKGAAGTTPDVVYALALCRGDTNASSCAACVTAAFRNAQQLCAFKKRATMFDNPCILRYSDQDFLANVTDNRGIAGAFNANNVSAGAAAAFDAASGRLVTATAEYAAEDPSRRFGTGEEVYDETYPKIYSLAQCTPDMTEADCRSCLRSIIAKYTPEYFVGKPGCRVLGVRCSFRLETYPFFAGRPLLQLRSMLPAAPAPAATGEGHPQKKEISAGHGYSRTRIKIYTIAGSSSILMLLFAFWLGHKKYKSKRKSKEAAKIESFLPGADLGPRPGGPRPGA